VAWFAPLVVGWQWERNVLNNDETTYLEPLCDRIWVPSIDGAFVGGETEISACLIKEILW